MASTQGMGPVITAILALLRVSVSLTTYVGVRVYPDTDGCDVPSRPTYPYISVETSGETPENTMGGTPNALKWGSHVIVHIRAVSQTRSDTQANTLTGIIKGILDGQPLTVVGYASADVAYESLIPLKANEGGMVTREWISSYDVLVHQ